MLSPGVHGHKHLGIPSCYKLSRLSDKKKFRCFCIIVNKDNRRVVSLYQMTTQLETSFQGIKRNTIIFLHKKFICQWVFRLSRGFLISRGTTTCNKTRINLKVKVTTFKGDGPKEKSVKVWMALFL